MCNNTSHYTQLVNIQSVAAVEHHFHSLLLLTSYRRRAARKNKDFAQRALELTRRQFMVPKGSPVQFGQRAYGTKI
jgi:hypothetical protein